MSQSSDQQVAAAEASLAQTGEVGEYAVPGAQSQSLAQASAHSCGLLALLIRGTSLSPTPITPLLFRLPCR